ncbi:MAG TPA: peptidoglycan-binding protein [Candidatus Stackebrandtia faecavium]|nr:peptidoglycan-binding protein [Candidatus Stackebrandtia faecavium]
MHTRRTILTSFVAGAGVLTLGAAATQAFADTTADADPREVDMVPGSTSSNVASLQYLLTAFGYKTEADGYYGPETEKSVVKFQAATDLVQDGEAGPITMKAMLSSKKVEVKAGSSNGDAVKAAQTQLVKHGNEMLVDGDFGPLTTSSVKKYQSKTTLPDTGTVDYLTWTYLLNPPQGDGDGLRSGPAVLVAQSGTGLVTWENDCGPSAFVCLQLRMGRTPSKWTDVAHRAAAIDYARRTDLRMTDDSRGTGQISDEVGVVDGFHRIGVDAAKAGGFDAALSSVRNGGISMLGGDLAVAAKWNGRDTGSVLHWVALLDYKSSSGKYQVADSSSKHNELVWVTADQLAAFAQTWGDSVYIQ